MGEFTLCTNKIYLTPPPPQIWTGPFFGPFFGLFFGPFFGLLYRGKHIISTQGGMGCSLLVLREGWKAECYYSGRGERRTISRQGEVGGGCNSKHFLLMELLLDRTNYDFLNVLHFCRHAKAKLPRKHWDIK